MDENDYPNLLNRYLLENLVNLPEPTWTYLNLPERIALTFVLPFYAKKDDLPIETNLKKFKKFVSKNVSYTINSLHRHKLWYSNNFIFGTLFYDKIIQVWNKSSIHNRLDDFDFVIFFCVWCTDLQGAVGWLLTKS